MRRGQEDAELDRKNLGDKTDLFSSPPRLSASSRHLVAVLVGLAVLASALLPANLLATQHFHHDEALYATWALQIVSGHDPWLTLTPIDKPPLFLYLLAGSMSLLGVTESAARIPSLLATAGTVLLTFWLGRRWYGARVGLTAAWLVALSSFTLLFAPTTFTDPLLVMWVLAACLAASYGRAGWAGVGLGLAIATKQQGVFFAPLVIMLFTIYDFAVRAFGGFTIADLRLPILLCTPLADLRFRLTLPAPRSSPHALRSPLPAPRLTPYASRFLLALLLTLLPLLIWDFSRRQTTDVFTRSLDNYGGLIIEWASLGERWQGFLDLLWYGTGSSLLNTIFVVGLPLLLAYGWWQATADRRPQTADGRPETENRGPATAETLHPSNLPPLQPSTPVPTPRFAPKWAGCPGDLLPCPPAQF